MEFHIAVIIICLGTYIWYTFSKIKEKATIYCQTYCKKINVQFLDGSIVLINIGIKRASSGSLQFSRNYRFDFSINSYDRYHGYIHLLGSQIEGIQFDHPDGKIFINDDSIHLIN